MGKASINWNSPAYVAVYPRESAGRCELCGKRIEAGTPTVFGPRRAKAVHLACIKPVSK
jgi:hypothetical protein